ncbi:hypothetical protein G4X40_18925 [Rhodococcus sp. D2-41]|uniref:cell division protein PerM n=1 Tax=Speluncibacter jeojiensis TaxID=2710754 RepID=UPI00240EAEB5|nr:DUF6350 family protein [Rhodococcus sp. D2-41]MDG3012218.1 hypothetical protein [Rhodococcus sp. D2-41]
MSLLLDRRKTARRGATPEQMRSLIRVAFVPSGIAVALIAAITLVTLVSVDSRLTGVFGAIASLWLAVHQVPVQIGSTDIGALPLLPTLLMIAGVARCCARVTRPEDPPPMQLRIVGAAVGGSLVVTVIALAVIQDATSVTELSSPDTLIALGGVAGIHALGAVLGVGRQVWRLTGERLQVPDWTRTSLRQGTIAGMSLLAAGSVLIVVGMLRNWSAVGDLIGAEDDWVGQLGLVLLSILYLPNVIVGAVGTLVGTEMHIGDATFGLFHVTGGPVPALPILGVLPHAETGGAWLALLAVIVVIGVRLGQGCHRERTGAIVLLRTVLTAAVGCGTAMAVVGFLAGGPLGSFGYVGVEPPLLGLLVFGWLAVTGSATVLLVKRFGPLRRRRRKPQQLAADAEQPARDAAANMIVMPTTAATEAGRVESSGDVSDEVSPDGADEDPADPDEAAAEADRAESDDAASEQVTGVTDEVSEQDLPESAAHPSD